MTNTILHLLLLFLDRFEVGPIHQTGLHPMTECWKFPKSNTSPSLCQLYSYPSIKELSGSASSRRPFLFGGTLQREWMAGQDSTWCWAIKHWKHPLPGIFTRLSPPRPLGHVPSFESFRSNKMPRASAVVVSRPTGQGSRFGRNFLQVEGARLFPRGGVIVCVCKYGSMN